MSSLTTRNRLIARPGEFLTDDDIRRVAPSVFAVEAHESRSERFAPIPTSAILNGLRDEGFGVVQVAQSRSRDLTRADFTRHMLRMRRVGDDTKAPGRKLGEVFPEAVLVNANDGTSAYVLSAGLFRLVCLNGAVVSDRELGGVRVSHTGEVTDRVIEGTYTVLEESVTAIEHAAAWQSIDLTPARQLAFAEQAHALRFADAEGKIATPITADQLLVARRYADRGDNLWAVFNRVQEAVTKGGLHGVRYDDRNRAHRVSTRPINGISQDVKLNKALWQLAATFAAAA